MTHEKNTYRTFPTGPDDVGRRLDRVARKFLAGQPLGIILGAIRRGQIRVNGKRREGGYRIEQADRVEVQPELCSNQVESAPEAGRRPNLPAWFRRSIILENVNILALNKPPGILVHGADSLQNIAREYLAPGERASLSFTPGPLHRLDRNTSGLLLFGKSTTGAARFSSLLKNHSVRKEYLALLEGRLARDATWTDRLRRDKRGNRTYQSEEGREVECTVTPICQSEEASLVLVTMRSGFTHQIRAQAAIHLHPLLGDSKYGARERRRGYLLHARALSLAAYDPVLGFRSLEAGVPIEFRATVQQVFGSKGWNDVLNRFATADGRLEKSP